MKKKFKAILGRFSPYKNIFFLVSVVFIVWMLFSIQFLVDSQGLIRIEFRLKKIYIVNKVIRH